MTARAYQIVTKRNGADRQAYPTSELLGDAEAQHVTIVDGSGNPITSFGGGTQYTEDVAAAADPVGNAVILIRKDTPATITTTDVDNVAQRGTNYGAAYTQIVTSTGSFVDSFGGGTQYTEGDTDASITGTALMLEGAANALSAAIGGAGAVSAAVQRVTLASDDPLVARTYTEKWSALSSETLVMPAANSLTSLANGGLVISSAFDNSTNRHQRAQLYLHVNGASAFTAGTTVDVWVIESNGTTYEDGDASTTPGRPPDGYFFLRATTNQQELYCTVDLPPASVKFLVRNSGGQAFDSTDANNTLGVRTYTTTQV